MWIMFYKFKRSSTIEFLRFSNVMNLGKILTLFIFDIAKFYSKSVSIIESVKFLKILKKRLVFKNSTFWQLSSNT